MPFATILESQRIGSAGPKRLGGKVRKTRRHFHVARQVGHAAGVDHANDEAFLGAGEARQISLGADHREGAPVDLGTFPHVFVCGAHGRCVPKTRMKSALLEQGASRSTIVVDAGPADGLMARSPVEHNLIGAFVAHQREIGGGGMWRSLWHTPPRARTCPEAGWPKPRQFDWHRRECRSILASSLPCPHMC